MLRCRPREDAAAADAVAGDDSDVELEDVMRRCLSSVVQLATLFMLMIRDLSLGLGPKPPLQLAAWRRRSMPDMIALINAYRCWR